MREFIKVLQAIKDDIRANSYSSEYHNDDILEICTEDACEIIDEAIKRLEK